MTQKVLMYFALFAAMLVVVPFLMGLVRYGRQDREQRILFIFLGLSTLIETGAITLFALDKNNYPLLHVFTIVEFVMLAWLYRPYLGAVVKPALHTFVLVAFGIFSIYNSLWLQPLTTFNTYARGISFLLLIFFGLVYLFHLIQGESTGIRKLPMFWINLAILLYYASGFFVVVMTNLVMPKLHIIWAIHNVFLVIHYLLYCKALWIKPAQ